MAFQIEPYSVADFLDWERSKRLKLNPDFQRRDAWSPMEKTLLIDTILRGLSMPKVYFRTVIDPNTQGMVRDVVDGQQRLRAIIAFANNELKLGKKAEEHEGKKYRDLTVEEQQAFLQYRIATEQLMNASDEDVIVIFKRLNQYGAKLNQAEIRNAEFDTQLKTAVVELSEQWWKKLLEMGYISLKLRSRMIDDEIIAELIQVHLLGIKGGDARSLRKLYEDHKNIDVLDVKEKVSNLLGKFTQDLSEIMPDNLKSRPHFIVMYAAMAEVIFKIPNGSTARLQNMTYRLPKNQDELDELGEKLSILSSIISSEEYPGEEWGNFYSESRAAPINIRSRNARFPVYLNLFAYENS